MKLLLTTNGRLYKNKKGEYYTGMVYEYSFFTRYLDVFEEIRLVAHVESSTDEYVQGMVRVDGPGLEIFEVPFPHGKTDYIKKYFSISSILKTAADGCSCAILRIPDQLAFQVAPVVKKRGIPLGVEVTSNSWEFFEKGSVNSPFRPFLRMLWDYQQKKYCRLADASCYVTKNAIQKRYPPLKASYSCFCSDVDISGISGEEKYYGQTVMHSLNVIHISGSIGGFAKGHLELLGAAAILKEKGFNLNIVLVGGGELDGACLRIVDENSLSIRYTGRLEKNEIINEMKKADLFVFPSYREGLPRVVVEAMAAGLPCVTTDLEGIKELIDGSMMVPVRDSKALADKIEFLMNNPSYMTEESKKNLDKVREYRPEALEEKRSKFYKHLRNLASS